MRWSSVCVSVMSLTPTQSMSAPASCAALKTFLPIRPKPLIPAVVANPVLSWGTRCPLPARKSSLSAGLWAACGSRAEPLRPPRRLVDVAVNDVDHVLAALGVLARQALADHNRAVPPTRASDPDGEVRLALALIRRQQVVEQRDHVVVEVGDPVGALDVVDHLLVEPRELAQLGLVVRIRQEAHVEEQVGIARGAVLEAVGDERDGELAADPLREHLVGD